MLARNTYYAHSANRTGERQELCEHLRSVAALAWQFGEAFGAGELARFTGLVHDIGKFNPAWQQYLLEAEAGQSRRRGLDHKGAGSVLATRVEETGLLAFLIAGHHGGLPARPDLITFVRDRMEDEEVRRAIIVAQSQLPELQAPPHFQFHNHQRELLIRMVFSALVDADFLDSEAHFNAGARRERETEWTIAGLRLALDTWYTTAFRGVEPSAINTLRNEVLQYCLEAAFWQPGIFRLTVPTGGGKTLAGLAFALRHAERQGLSRIMYAIPFTSIIDQTAAVFKEILGDNAVLEHHSALTISDPENPSPAEVRRRLVSENWDAPLIVTTTVQLFESLMARLPSKCRKLHNIAKSVIILDEVQMLPVHLLTIILDVLNQLVANYGCSVLLCTATQPTLEVRIGFEGLVNIREIIPAQMLTEREDVNQLRRVEYQLPHRGETWTWEEIAARLWEEQQGLVVLNTKRDAFALLDAIEEIGWNDSSLYHLSARQCGAHRKVVLAEVRRRLREGEACRLVSTQVIEAGVDVDFPRVLRAVGPLDRIVQAAGRCNREGRMEQPGQVIVFTPTDAGRMPPGSYTLGTNIAMSMIDRGADLHDPETYEQYFREYYDYPNLDPGGIQELRGRFDYPEVQARFKMIQDEDVSVLVDYGEALTVLAEVLTADTLRREHYRALQPYMVGISNRQFTKYQGIIEEVLPGVYVWAGQYDGDGARGRGIRL